MKALIIAGKLSTDQEVFYPFYRMQEEGWEVDIAVKDKETVLGEKGIKIVPTLDTEDMPTSVYDVLILPGGAKAMEYLRQDKTILTFIAFFHTYGKRTGVIGAICHGTQLLITAGLVKGRRVSGYYSIKDDIVNAGGEFVDAPFVVDDRIVSSPHYKYLGPWMHEVIAVAKLHAQSL